jgi:hypothetical protein
VTVRPSPPRKVGSFLIGSLPSLEKAEASPGSSFSGVVLWRWNPRRLFSTQSPQKCPKCSNTENLTVAVTNVPDRESTWGGRVVWDNDTATTCGACGFIGKVADFEPTDTYSPENEEAWAEIARGMARGEDKYLPARCRQPWGGDPIVDETEIKRITDALLKAYPPRDPNEPKAAPTYGFDIETERRREVGFLEEIRRRRWTIEAYDDQGNIVETCHAAELSVAVEIAKELEEEYPRVDIITPKGSVLPRREWRH